jgi:aminopeptidase-like protein
MTTSDRLDILPLTRELCGFRTGVVADDNEALFARLGQELDFTIQRFASGDQHNGWVVPQNWIVDRATISHGGRTVFDGTVHPLALGMYSRSFQGTLDLEELKPHLVSNPDQPDAYMFHSIWQIRSWAPDWIFCMPHDIYRTLEPGSYDIDLQVRYEPGEMLVASFEHRGRSDKTIVFNTNTCHPTQANDGFCAVSMLVRLFQWLRTQDTHYSYRLILAPEHLGSVFYMRGLDRQEKARLVSGIFAEMPGNRAQICVTSTFLGNQRLDLACRNAVRASKLGTRLANWREGCGNDETVWEAPGHEVPFVEITRALSPDHPYPEYHSSNDNPDLMDLEMVYEFYETLQQIVATLETDSRLHRHFDGLICLSHPDYDLYFERHDPTIDKALTGDDERWGHLLDSLLRYMDGSITLLEIAQRHDLPYPRLLEYVRQFGEKGLVTLEFAPIERQPISLARPPA